jgi:integrase
VFPSLGEKCYTSDSYRRAIQRVCERRGIDSWSPNQLRKRAATAIREEFDVEHAASVLGHSSSVVTAQHYAEACRERAMKAARKLG